MRQKINDFIDNPPKVVLGYLNDASRAALDGAGWTLGGFSNVVAPDFILSQHHTSINSNVYSMMTVFGQLDGYQRGYYAGSALNAMTADPIVFLPALRIASLSSSIGKGSSVAETTGGALRVQNFGAGWQSASLEKAISRHGDRMLHIGLQEQGKQFLKIL